MAYWPSSAAIMSLAGGCWLVRKMPTFMPGSVGSRRAEGAEIFERRRCRVVAARRRRFGRRAGDRLVGAHGGVGLLVAHLDGELRLGVGHRAIIDADRDLAIVQPHQRDVLLAPIIQERHGL